MALSEFLSIVGIRFPPEIPAKALRRRSTFIADYGKRKMIRTMIGAVY